MGEPAIAEEFSEGYYLSRFYIKPTEGRPTVNIEDFYDLQYDIYESGEHKDEIMCKLGSLYFQILPRERTASGTLELPTNMLEKVGVENPPIYTEVFVVKPWVMDYLTFRGT